MPLYYPPLPQVNTRELKRYAGLKNAAFDENLVDEAAAEIMLLAKPKTSYEIYDYDAANGVILSSPPFELDGRNIINHLKTAEKVCIIAATIGDAAENAVSEYFKEDRYAYSLLLDAAATCAVELAADCLEKELARLAAKDGLKLKWRFSPGYGDWDLKAQPRLAGLSNATSIGVNLTESLMLEPRKSITAVIGLVGSAADCGENLHNCTVCNKIDCPMRKNTF